MDTQGKIIKKLELQTGVSQATGKEWKKQDFILETFGDYPKKICFTAWGTMVEHLDNRKVGDPVKIVFDIESREYNERWYTDCKAIRIELIGA